MEFADKINKLTNSLRCIENDHFEALKSINTILEKNEQVLSNQSYISNQVKAVVDSAKLTNSHIEASSQAQAQYLIDLSGKIDRSHDELISKIKLNKPSPCTKCVTTSKDSVTLKSHVNTSHIEQNKPENYQSQTLTKVTCTKCDFKANSSSQMNKHLKFRHYEDQPGLLFVGDSVSGNLNFGLLEREIQKPITAAKAEGLDQSEDSGGRGNGFLIDRFF